MPTVKDLQEELGRKGKAVQDFVVVMNDKDEVRAEDEEKFQKLTAEYDSFKKRVDMAARAEAIERELQEPEDGDETPSRPSPETRKRQEKETRGDKLDVEEARAYSIQAWALRGKGLKLSEKHHRACQQTGVDPQHNELELSFMRTSEMRQYQREFRAQSTGATSGGETIPEGFVRNFEKALLQFGGMRQVSDIRRTSGIGDLPWPHTNDTANKGAILAENGAVTEQDIVTGALVLESYKYTSKLIKVSVELLQDSAFDLASELGTMLGERIGRITEEHFTTGTGTDEPRGFVTACVADSATVAAAASGAIAYADLVNLIHGVDAAYRPNSRFMMSDTILAVVRKIVDGNSVPLWQPSVQAGIPDRILGFPFVVNQEMDTTMALNDESIAFGDFSKYKIRDVNSLRLRRLVERYADNDQEGFVAFSRHDGDMLNAGTDPIKCLQHPV